MSFVAICPFALHTSHHNTSASNASICVSCSNCQLSIFLYSLKELAVAIGVINKANSNLVHYEDFRAWWARPDRSRKLIYVT